MLKLAFGYKSRSGKDTACEFLQLIHGGVIVRFAKPIYESARVIYKSLGVPYQKDPLLLQFIGEYARGIDPNIFVNKLIKTIDEIGPGTNILVADLRYQNEAQVLKERGFVLIKIIRSERPIDRPIDHISETSLDNYKFDITIENDGTVEDFHRKLITLFPQINDGYT